MGPLLMPYALPHLKRILARTALYNRRPPKALTMPHTNPAAPLAFALTLCGLALFSPAARAMTRAESLVNSFAVMCLTQPMDFKRSDEQATAMKLPVVQENNLPPNDSGAFVHAKTWVMTLNDGPHAFMAAEGQGPNGRVQSCGIADTDIDAEEFKTALRQALKIDTSSKTPSQDGKRFLSKWPFGADSNIMFVTPAPGSEGGIYINLMQVKPNSGN